MSWFTSLFSGISFPPPADSIRHQTQAQSQLESQSQLPKTIQQQKQQIRQQVHPQKRLLEESTSTSATTTPLSEADSHLPPSPDPTLTPSEYQAQQELGRRRNKLIFAAGVAFLGLSILTTRRSLARRRLASQPSHFYKDAPSHTEEQAKSVSGALEAVQALQIATINVFSAAMLATGAGLWYLDVNSLGDARRMIRGGLGVDGQGKTEAEADEEIEEVIASILARKDAKVGRK